MCCFTTSVAVICELWAKTKVGGGKGWAAAPHHIAIRVLDVAIAQQYGACEIAYKQIPVIGTFTEHRYQTRHKNNSTRTTTHRCIR
jgi:hypothetical protein